MDDLGDLGGHPARGDQPSAHCPDHVFGARDDEPPPDARLGQQFVEPAEPGSGPGVDDHDASGNGCHPPGQFAKDLHADRAVRDEYVAGDESARREVVDGRGVGSPAGTLVDLIETVIADQGAKERWPTK